MINSFPAKKTRKKNKKKFTKNINSNKKILLQKNFFSISLNEIPDFEL